MSHDEIIKLLNQQNKNINYHGDLQDTSWKCPTFLIFIIIIFINLYYIYTFYIKSFPITLHCTTLYSNFIEQLLILNKLPYYKIANHYINHINYFTSSKKKSININPSVKEWVNDNIHIIPLCDDELITLSKHLHINIEKLREAQDKVLSLLPDINAYHIIRENYLEDEEYENSIYDIKEITKIHDNLYKIKSAKNYFYTNLILSDQVILNIGDVMNGFYYSEIDKEVYTENKYIVNHQYQLESLSKKLKEDIMPLPFYNLQTPRSEIKTHPFHLPTSKDPILSLLIMTQAIIDY